MDLKVVSELVKLMNNSKLSALEIEEKEFRIKLEKNLKNSENEEISVDKKTIFENYSEVNDVITYEKHETTENKEEETVKPAIDETNVKIVKSPIVGTFYSAASPEAEVFAVTGKKVKKGDTLCIIEAMKLMNEIESEFDGEIVEILVSNGAMVEYGQPLFKLV